MVSKSEKRVIKEEKSQAIVRNIFSSVLFLSTYCLYSFEMIPVEAMNIVIFTALFSVFWTAYVNFVPGDYQYRRIFIMFLDSLAVFTTIYFMGKVGLIYIFVILWTTVGNAIRFGSNSLKLSMVINIIGFTFLVSMSDYWKSELYLTIGMYFILFIIPPYVLKLTNRLSDVSGELEQQLAKAEHAARHDHLSGLFNRDAFYQKLDECISQVNVKDNTSLEVMYLDLDGFKKINDELGHKYGDIVIQKIADRLRRVVRETDTVCRLGGDEFAIVMYGDKETFDIKKATQRIINKISEPINVDNASLHVTASIGISRYPDNGDNAETLTDTADSAMYRSKSSGKDRFTFCFDVE